MEQIAQDNNHLRNAKLLRETMDTEGWKKIIDPLLNKMICDIVGFKRDTGEWDSGAFGDKRLGENRADRLLWYRQFGIDFNNNLYSFYNIARIAELRLKELEKRSKDAPPMTNTKYKFDSTDSTTRFGDSSYGNLA